MEHSAGGIVLNSHGDVLVVNQKGISWSLPKGHIEDGEDALAAAKREIEEESGVSRLTLIRELGTYERAKIDAPATIKRLTLFLFTTDEMDLAPKDPHNPEARWVKKHDVAALLTHEKDREFYRNALQGL